MRGLIFKENTSPPCRPYCILVEFDDYRGPLAVENPDRYIVRIVSETVQSNARCGKSGSRVPFPLVLSWAITIDKYQGMTSAEAKHFTYRLVDDGWADIKIRHPARRWEISPHRAEVMSA